MKPFNLKEAKDGHPVCTRDDRNARIICFDRLSNDQRSITYLVKDDYGVEVICSCKENGRIDADKENSCDLMMIPKVKKGWINIYENSMDSYSGVIYPTEEEAIDKKDVNCVATKMIEWEE